MVIGILGHLAYVFLFRKYKIMRVAYRTFVCYPSPRLNKTRDLPLALLSSKSSLAPRKLRPAVQIPIATRIIKFKDLLLLKAGL